MNRQTPEEIVSCASVPGSHATVHVILVPWNFTFEWNVDSINVINTVFLSWYVKMSAMKRACYKILCVC